MEHSQLHTNIHSTHTQDQAIENIQTVFILNVIFTLLQLVGALLTNSVTLLTECVHDFGDSVFLGLSWRFEKLSFKRADRRFTFGYRRFSVLSAFISAMVISSTSLFAIYEAIPRLLRPEEINTPLLMWFAIGGVVFNGLGVLKTIRSDGWNESLVNDHAMEDFLGWIAVLFVSGIVKATGYYIFDPITSIGLAFFWLSRSIKKAIKISKILLEATPEQIDLEQVLDSILAIDGVISIHDDHLWSIDHKKHNFTLHVVSNEHQELITKQVHDILYKFGIFHATIQVEHENFECNYAYSHH